MKCPICNNEIIEGGLVIDGVAPGWVPMEEFQKKRIEEDCTYWTSYDWKDEYYVQSNKSAKCLLM